MGAICVNVAFGGEGVLLLLIWCVSVCQSWAIWCRQGLAVVCAQLTNVVVCGMELVLMGHGALRVHYVVQQRLELKIKQGD